MRKLLITLGITPDLSGYRFIITAVEYCKNHSNPKWAYEVYPYVATQHNTTASRVERAIRHAMTHLKQNDLYHEIFGDLTNLTVSAFIMCLVVYLCEE